MWVCLWLSVLFIDLCVYLHQYYVVLIYCGKEKYRKHLSASPYPPSLEQLNAKIPSERIHPMDKANKRIPEILVTFLDICSLCY